MTSPFAIVGFDLDGTLLDTSGDLAAAVNHALAGAGRPALTTGQVTTMIGGGAKHMLAQALDATGGCDESEFRGHYKALLGYYGNHLAVHTRPYPGAIAAVEALRASGTRVGVVTNKFEGFATRLLDALGLAPLFDVVIGGDTMGPGRSKPAPDGVLALVERLGGGRAAFVGDSIYDIQAGKAAGLPTVAVSFGFLLQPVGTLGADAVIDHFDQLSPVLARLSATWSAGGAPA
ncbi:phosphoglycolate phosphatase [Sphingomonas guangdongensis]|uniref:Phosphoglycolate phosphatase n=1 Tax=Sphingomonas guangdongensis TaxID=1141890 RepID=A0A285QYE2_9SPHN|nr:HAD-IA family hydrolase [Sphingomonas guangdongensis]SOB86846.1 phosphoglycolate phosphatase [Sphingomonas guangdongensis]